MGCMLVWSVVKKSHGVKVRGTSVDLYALPPHFTRTIAMGACISHACDPHEQCSVLVATQKVLHIERRCGSVSRLIKFQIASQFGNDSSSK